jgi:hypothetical protein
MSNPKEGDLINRLEQIIDELGRLYAEADQILDSRIEMVRERMTPPRARQHEPLQ